MFGFGKKDKHENSVLALIIDAKKGKDLEYIEETKIPVGSPLRFYRNKLVHYLKRSDSVLEIINPEMEIILGLMPSDLYEALVCPDIEIVYGAEPQPWYKSKSMPYVIVIAIGVFALFMMTAAGGGFG